MAIRLRRGTNAYFDPTKLVQGELAVITDTGELYFCFSAGNTKKLQTEEDLLAVLGSSATAYSALIQLIADLELNPSELTNILNNITALQSGKIDKTSIVQTDTVNDATKVPSSAVTFALGAQIDELSDNLALKINNTTGLPQVTNGSFFVSGVDADTLKHTGAYYCSGASAELHYPSGAGFMRVMAAYDNVTYQQYYPAASDTYYVRRYVSSAWTAWVAK
jgi:hypothetical protein